MACSIKNQESLRGIFPTAKPPAKRNFLRENKLKIKELEKQASNHRNKELQQQQQRFNRNGYNFEKSKEIIPIRKARSQIFPMTNTKSNAIKRVTSGCSCLSKNTDGGTMVTNNCDKEIQTDDILDEEFLNDALKRCLSKDVINDNQIHLSLPELTEHVDNEDNKSTLNGRHSATQETSNGHCGDGQNILESNENKVQISSRANRSNVKLPKYLEKEKREKELRKQRALEKDPNCPKGHYALNENERQETVRNLKLNFQKLIDELNRLPISRETLKIRNRRIEIEKSLTELEKTIRIFSKPKVYVPNH